MASRLTAVLLLLALGGPRTWCCGQQQDDERDLAQVTLASGKQEVSGYRFVAHDGSQQLELKLHGESLLHWSNPAVGEVYGDVFLWTASGRPEVIGSYYRFFSPFKQTVLELHSLSLGKITASQGEGQVWAPQSPGVTLQPIDGAASPAELSAARLNQMKRLARQFRVQVEDRRTDDRQAVTRDLRLLTRPVYRYGDGKGDLVDGALFAFVAGTDPEALLLIEARRTPRQTTWRYGFARMNIDRLTGYHQEQQVWQAEQLQPPWHKPNQPYTLFVRQGGED